MKWSFRQPGWLAAAMFAAAFNAPAQTIENVIDVAPVWAGHPVGFMLHTRPPRQYVAFYDAERHMTVASRDLTSTEWTPVRLPEAVRWDSHNYITFSFDDEGFIHLSGNMHNVPLVYFRTRQPLEIETFERIPSMTGHRENRVTYPRFFRGPGRQFIFTYRDGGSGNGDQLYNIYDPTTRTWRRLLDQPLVSGEGKKNAYLQGPTSGPDGFWHLIWMWRDTPDCATNHRMSYARSRDLIHWEKSSGQPLELPITFDTCDVVDDVPARAGLLNVNQYLGFDSQNRPVVSYHKFDDNGQTQVYNARLEEGVWKVYQTSDWDYRWWFEGGGSIVVEIRHSGVSRAPDHGLVQSYSHPKHGSGRWLLDEETLKPIGKAPSSRAAYPASLRQVESDFPGMQANIRTDGGRSGRPGISYLLRWETLGSNRDRPRQGPLPEPSPLRVYEIKD
jgi:hypothetical protein